MQGCVHATRRAQSGLGSASRPAYSSIRCEAAAQAANRRGGSGRGPLGRPHLAGMRCVATRKPRAARRARSGLGPASWPADSSLAKQGCPGGPHRRARRPRAGPSAGPQARSGLGQTSRRAHIKLAVRQGCCSCRAPHGGVGNESAVLPSRAQRHRCPPRAAATKQSQFGAEELCPVQLFLTNKRTTTNQIHNFREGGWGNSCSSTCVRAAAGGWLI